MRRSRPPGAGLAAHTTLAALLLVAAPSAADTTDGAYGRFDGDLDLSIGAGAAFAHGGPTAAALARVMYLGTAGLYAAYTDAFGADRPVLRSASVGVGVRPLFLPRWGYDLEQGPATLDLALDALTLDFGVLLAKRPSDNADSGPGVEAALSTEVPLIGRATGPWIGLRGAIQWRAGELASRADLAPESTRFVGLITLSWHAIVDCNIIDARDRALR